MILVNDRVVMSINFNCFLLSVNEYYCAILIPLTGILITLINVRAAETEFFLYILQHFIFHRPALNGPSVLFSPSHSLFNAILISLFLRIFYVYFILAS